MHSPEHPESTTRNRLSYAIPMPYIPSSPAHHTKSSPTRHHSSSGSDNTEDRRIDINMSPPFSSSTSSSLELATCSPAKVISPLGVQSRAVVRYAEVALPNPLNKIERNTDLRDPPKNWLREGQNMKGFVHSPHLKTGFSSFKMANDFFDCLPDVDVVSDGANIKKLLKMPFSNSVVSMIVHRVGKTLLIDDFDIHKYLLRRSATEWDWLRKYFTQTVLQQIDKKQGAVVRKNCSNSALQQRNLVSKFLYRSLQHSEGGHPEEEEEEERVRASLDRDEFVFDQEDEAGSSDVAEAVGRARVTAAAAELNELSQSLMECAPPLPDPEIEKNIPQFSATEEGRFVRNFLWTFEDIRMLIGSNMPIFGDDEHPCVSLRLRDMQKPINVLTGMDYWLDNLMCQVPEVVMCYHLDGIVQRYELIKTEDLPALDGSNFSPKIVKNIAQNVLSFLKSNAAKEGHTYWLFKGKNDEIVKLYDLTSLSQKDSGIKPTTGSGTADEEAGDTPENITSGGEDSDHENPFQTPVSLLLYRLARNILESGDRKEDDATARALLQNCVQLIDKSKFPHIATSAHFLLSELYVPSDTDPSKPSFPKVPSTKRKDVDSDDPVEIEVSEACSVEVNSLCHPYIFQGFEERCAPPISADVEFRCREALVHIELGLKYLTTLEAVNRAKEAAYRKERENIERDNITMSVPGQPIPMGYISADANRLVPRRTRSLSCGELSRLREAPKHLSTAEYLKFLLLKKCLLVYITLAEANYDLSRFGRSLRCVKRALNCHSMIESLGGSAESEVTGNIISFSLGVAGDCYMAFVSRWQNVPLYQEQYNTDGEGEEGIAKEIEKYTEETDRDWTIKQPKDIQEGMELACRCYRKALEFPDITTEDRQSLLRRLGNVNNELGVFFMNQATALVHQVSAGGGDGEDGEEEGSAAKDEDPESALVVMSAVAAAQELLEKSQRYLQEGIGHFESIRDSANIALLLSNSGRLWRISGHAKGLTRTSNKEEVSSEEMAEYKRATDQYLKALNSLGNRKVNPGVWDSVTWELCCTFFTVGTLYQDQAPLSTTTRDEAEKQVTEFLVKALKYCDIDSVGPRQVVYQYRAAIIHQRLASLYHHSFRCYDADDTSFRKKKLKQLSELHYTKSSALFLQLDRHADFLRSVLERAGLLEAQLDAHQLSAPARARVLAGVLEILGETQSVVERLAATHNNSSSSSSSGSAGEEDRADVSRDSDKTDEEREDESRMLTTLLQRLQATLLALYKVVSAPKPGGGKKPSAGGGEGSSSQLVKSLYASSLKVKPDSPETIFTLLKEIASQLPAVIR